jgi:shikimate dehydrogenase
MLLSLNGETRLHLIIGDPVAQTRSPAGLSKEFALRRVNAVCVPIHVGRGEFDQFMRAAKLARNVDGIVVTMPHKFAALRHCDEASERAEFLGAVNVLHRIGGGGWRGDMTDGIATVAALRRAGSEPGGTRALVVGAGGAGSAVALALVEAGVASLAVVDLDAARRDALAERLAGRAGALAWPGPPELMGPGLPEGPPGPPDPAGFDLIVNATPAGMRPDDPLPVDATRIDARACVADLIARPAMTPLLVAARRRGAKVVTGEDMFAVQAGIMADMLLASPAC